MKGLIRVTLCVFCSVILLGAGFNLAAQDNNNPNSTIRYVVTVIDNKNFQPVAGASVVISRGLNVAGRDRFVTDADGKVYFITRRQVGFDVKVSHKDYQPGVSSLYSDGKTGDFPVEIQLTRKYDTKRVVVNLTAADDKRPVADALVRLSGATTGAAFEASTDSAGQAAITVDQSDDYEIAITHSKFERVTTAVTIRRYEGSDRDPNEFTFNFELKRKKALGEEERTLILTVQGRVKRNRLLVDTIIGKADPIQPLKGAQVSLEDGQFIATDENGRCEMTHKFPLGETVKVEVEKMGYETANASFIVGANGSENKVNVTAAKGVTDYLTVTLRKEGEEEERTLIVKVMGKDKNATLPLEGANVALAEGEFTTTNALTSAGTYEVAYKAAPGKTIGVAVKKKGYKDAAASFVAAENRSRDSLTVTLEKEPEERKLIVTVQGKDGDGNMGPVKYAGVNLPDGEFKITDRYGQCQLKHTYAAGERVAVRVDEVKGYKAKSDAFIVGTTGEDRLSITLEKTAEARTLYVKVMRKEKDGFLKELQDDAEVTLADGQFTGLKVRLDDLGGMGYQIKHTLGKGETAAVNVRAKKYKTKTKPYTVSSDDEDDTILVDLEPEETNEKAEGFAGTWLDDSKRVVYTITDDGGTISGSYRYDFPDTYHANARGDGTFSGCVVKNSRPNCPNCVEYEATCSDWTGSHEDDHKTISCKGTMTLKLHGNYLTAITTHQSSTVKWKGGVPLYGTDVSKGAWEATELRRPKY